jgi:electron transport complex protein RnfD
MDFSLFQKPQVSLARSTNERMWLVGGAAFLAVLQSSLSDSFRSLLLALAVLSGALLMEFLCNKKNVKDGSAAASAMILTLFLPNQLNPLYGFFGGVFAMVVVKYSFGGLGSNWVNPAAGGWLFIRTSWPLAFNKNLENSPLIRLASVLKQGFTDPQGSPLLIFKLEGWQDSLPDRAVSGFFNDTVFSLTQTKLPEGYLSFFSGRGEGIIADRGLFFFFLGTIVLFASRSFRSWLPPAFLFVYSLLVKIFGALPFGGTFWSGDILFALLSGGVLAAAFLLISDPATGPKSTPGYAVYVFLTAFFLWFFRFVCNEPYGAVPAVLLGNVLVPLIRSAENRLYYERRRES